jgi:hypothetical protein
VLRRLEALHHSLSLAYREVRILSPIGPAANTEVMLGHSLSCVIYVGRITVPNHGFASRGPAWLLTAINQSDACLVP